MANASVADNGAGLGEDEEFAEELAELTRPERR